MMPRRLLLTIALATGLAAPGLAQLAVPALPVPRLPAVAAPVDGLLASLDETVRARAAELLQLRGRTLDRLLRANRDTIERDRFGELARRGELLVLDVVDAALAPALNNGFIMIAREPIEGLDLTVVRLAVPAGQSLAKAQARLEELLPGATVSADNLHWEAGRGSSGSVGAARPAAVPAIATPVGVIDGGTGSGASAQRGYAKGAPRASDHGSAVVSLLSGAGVRSIRVADVFGADPAGGNALAITRALGWLAQGGAKVVTISLVGPSNPVLARAIASAQKRGVVVVAAVGNDGPAAPPAYPASYAGVLAVTGVDRRDRPLIEAGRALHLDYAAPGAELLAANAAGARVKVRGTSFAAPLVAARVAATLDAGGSWQSRLDGEARDLGPRGPDKLYGRGLLCGTCRPAS